MHDALHTSVGYLVSYACSMEFAGSKTRQATSALTKAMQTVSGQFRHQRYFSVEVLHLDTVGHLIYVRFCVCMAGTDDPADLHINIPAAAKLRFF